MKETMERIQLDELQIPIRRSSRRKSVGITVDRDGSVFVAAPNDCDREKIDAYVRGKSLWIYRKLAQREALVSRPRSRKEFVDGSCFWFLGTAHRLRIVDEMPAGGDGEPLRLAGEWFLLQRDSVDHAKELFRRWYVDHGRPIVERVVDLYRDRVAIPAQIDLREIGFRWGSCTKEGKVLISWRAIQLPADALEYVVVHEMVHLLHHRHDDNFWHQLRKVMPDYEERKEWLAKNQNIARRACGQSKRWSLPPSTAISPVRSPSDWSGSTR